MATSAFYRLAIRIFARLSGHCRQRRCGFCDSEDENNQRVNIAFDNREHTGLVTPGVPANGALRSLPRAIWRSERRRALSPDWRGRGKSALWMPGVAELKQFASSGEDIGQYILCVI